MTDPELPENRTEPKWEWCRVPRTRFYRVWRYHPHSLYSVTGKRGVEQLAATVDDFGNLIFVQPKELL